MSGKSSRTKGHNFERKIARDLTEATGMMHRRVLTETRDGNYGDVRARGLPVVYQCKCQAKPNVWAAVKEAMIATGPGDYAVAAVKRTTAGGSPSEEIAAMPWDDWLEIVSELTKRGVWG